ncbi:MAG TPA: amidohydrolase family protein [Spirochaetia bacterium]|nr:amidohydrolase family protein [Spirochaetia bacterium]
MSLIEDFKTGKPLTGEYLLDGHMHVGRVAKFHTLGSRAEEIVRKMDLLGIRLGVISSLSGSGETRNCNRLVREVVQDYPGRFIGLIMLNPNYPDGWREEIDSCWKSGCFKGIKLHPEIHMYPIDGPFYLETYEKAAGMGCPVLIHTWGVDDVMHFDALAAKFPRTIFILGHSGGEVPAVLQAMKLAKKYTNLYLDTTCTWMYGGLIELMVATAGSKKILYGSDAVWNSMEAALGRILFADITEGEKRDIIGLNMKRVLGI